MNTPIRRIRPDGCALAPTGHNAVPAKRLRKFRRLMRAPGLRKWHRTDSAECFDRDFAIAINIGCWPMSEMGH